MSDVNLEAVAAALVKSYRDDPRGHRVARRHLPSREEVVEILQLCLALFFPGYHGPAGVTAESVDAHVSATVARIHELLTRQVDRCLCHAIEEGESGEAYDGCAEHAARVSARLIAKLPALRAALLEDLQAAYDGDPAAHGLDEIVLAYPGFLAVVVHRVAHEIFEMGVPLMPRIMSEWAHARTGCDLHPGARLGRRFFIDHATGTVVGETSVIGDDVKLYQGVTLGALSHPRDAEGRVIRNQKRHPTVEDGATLYANATVLGGATVVGRGATVGGSVFVTRSVPAGAKVILKAEQRVRTIDDPSPPEPDFEI